MHMIRNRCMIIILNDVQNYLEKNNKDLKENYMKSVVRKNLEYSKYTKGLKCTVEYVYNNKFLT